MARNNNSRIIAVFVLLLGSTIIQMCEGTPVPLRRYHVEIENRLSGRPLNVHCKSGDDDLGVHILQPGQKYEWGFKLNYFTTTLFFCNMRWEFGQKSFEVFKTSSKLIYDWCGGKTCQWRASEYGLQMYHSKTGAWDLKYTWVKK